VPLIILTADRPMEAIDQGENQSMYQYDIYKNYIKKSFELPVDCSLPNDLRYSDRIINEAYNIAISPCLGPVHINIPLREPLYDTEYYKDDFMPKVINEFSIKSALMHWDSMYFKTKWNTYQKKVILVGSLSLDPFMLKTLINIAEREDVVILSENISNICHPKIISTIDAVIENITKNNLLEFKPDLIITLGGGMISKKVKFWLRSFTELDHWHISPTGEHWDTYLSLSEVIKADASTFLDAMQSQRSEEDFNDFSKANKPYSTLYHKLVDQIYQKTQTYVSTLPFCDMSVFEFIIEHIEAESVLHLGNSTPIRYANLFPTKDNILYFANRGVSGIDGCVSTALGHSLQSDVLNLCIVGDVSFRYDINAWWNNLSHPKFKCIVINNGGGDIFNIIPGPDQLTEQNEFFVTPQVGNVSALASHFKINYMEAKSLPELSNVFEEFIDSDASTILEIFTENSDNHLKKYFEFISERK
jgi:2-succinyl-5-enolpyruvyl-6-hydroxy-3-cyclohexene-1-carboxylate synthase